MDKCKHRRRLGLSNVGPQQQLNSTSNGRFGALLSWGDSNSDLRPLVTREHVLGLWRFCSLETGNDGRMEMEKWKEESSCPLPVLRELVE